MRSLSHETDAHGVDQNVVVVAGVEIGLPAHGRNAHAVAVVADARNDARHEMARLGVVRRAEAERVHVGDGPRAHGEYVAHDAAHAGRGSLIGLDIGGMVVALHLEHGGLAVAEIDHARILAGPLNDLRAFGRELFQPDARGLVGAVLRPHHREDAELGERRLPAECLEQSAIFIRAQAVLGDERFGNALCHLRCAGGPAQGNASARAANILAPSVPPSARSARRSG